MHRSLAVRLFVSALALVFCAFTALAAADEYPTRRVTIVVPVPPGGPMDFVARTLAAELQKRWGQVVIAENRPGAGALIGAEVVARAPADGHTLLIHNTSIVAYPLFIDTKFDAGSDLAPISTVMHAPYVLFGSANAPRTLREVLAYSKAHPDKLNIAVIPNTLQQLRTFKLLRTAGIRATMIPYPGTSPVQRALLANEVQLYTASSFGMETFVKEGRMHAIATLAKEPYWGFPDVPTAKAQGVDFETSEQYIAFAPAGTPRNVVDKLASAIAEIVKEPQVANQIRKTGNEAYALGPEALQKALGELSREAQSLARQAGIEKKK